MSLTNVGTFCDRCADRHVAALTGFAVLPDPPAPLTMTGPDGRRHRMVFRLRRAPTGISVELTENRRAPRRRGGGGGVSVLGAGSA